MIATDNQLTRQIIEDLPHYRKATNGEYSSACPFCNDGEDRFRFWPEKGNFWCRRCEAKGFVLESTQLQLDPELLAEWQAKEDERKLQEAASQLEKLERLNASHDVERYHDQLTPGARLWWHTKGVTDATIERYRLGYTTNCPTAKGHESYTIPITYRGRLYNIRHRLADGDNGNKYRPEMAGLPSAMFNADVLQDDLGFSSEVVLVEGEIKAMVLQQYGFDTVAIPGANTFKDKWISLFRTVTRPVYVALDPGVEVLAAGIWQQLGQAGIDARLCHFPLKPDDFFVLYGGSSLDFFSFLQLGKRYKT